MTTSSSLDARPDGPPAIALTTSAWLNTKRRSTESSIGSRAPHPVASRSRPASGAVVSVIVLPSEAAVSPDERVGAAVVREVGLRAGELGDDRGGELLAELDAPLVERVDVPDRPLGEHLVLVGRNQLSERERRQPLGKDHVRRVVAGEAAVRLTVGRGATEGESLGL